MAAILENGRHVGFSSAPEFKIKLRAILRDCAEFDACIIICTILGYTCSYLLHYLALEIIQRDCIAQSKRQTVPQLRTGYTEGTLANFPPSGWDQ